MTLGRLNYEIACVNRELDAVLSGLSGGGGLAGVGGLGELTGVISSLKKKVKKISQKAEKIAKKTVTSVLPGKQASKLLESAKKLNEKVKETGRKINQAVVSDTAVKVMGAAAGLVNVIPGVGQVASVAIGGTAAAIAAKKQYEDQRRQQAQIAKAREAVAVQQAAIESAPVVDSPVVPESTSSGAAKAVGIGTIIALALKFL